MGADLLGIAVASRDVLTVSGVGTQLLLMASIGWPSLDVPNRLHISRTQPELGERYLSDWSRCILRI